MRNDILEGRVTTIYIHKKIVALIIFPNIIWEGDLFIIVKIGNTMNFMLNIAYKNLD